MAQEVISIIDRHRHQLQREMIMKSARTAWELEWGRVKGMWNAWGSAAESADQEPALQKQAQAADEVVRERVLSYRAHL